MLRNPSIAQDGKPELHDDEQILYELNLCGIDFGELTGNGTFYVTTRRIVWLNTSASSSEDTTCYSFSSLLVHLMIHALCKESSAPYLFLQVENQEDDIKIMHKSYDELQATYHALCEGQKLNPCEGDSDDAGDAFMAFGGNNNDDEEKEKQEQQRVDYIAEHWDSKLILNDEPHKDTQTPMVNNNGYLEPAKHGQFDDAEIERQAATQEAQQQQEEEEHGNAPDEAESENDENDEPEEIDIDRILSLGLNKTIDNSDKKRTGSVSGISASFNPFDFAENVFDSKPSTPTKRRQSKTAASIQEQSTTEGDNENPYLDPNVLRGFGHFAPQQNESFEKKFKSYKDVHGDVRAQKKKDTQK